MHLAVAQSPAELSSPAARLNWLRSTLTDIAKTEADLVLLPELFACGYNIGDDILRRAEPADGPTYVAITKLAQEFGMAIHYGYAERDGERLYNSATCVSPDGKRLCHQRKLAIPPGWERDYFSRGQGSELFDFCGVKIATLICYDAEFAETVRHVATMGAELVLVPTALGANWSWVAHSMIPTRAYENGVYLAYANSAGTENNMEFLGASVIAAPEGAEVARAGSRPEILYTDIDKTRVTAAQARLPYLTDRNIIQLS